VEHGHSVTDLFARRRLNVSRPHHVKQGNLLDAAELDRLLEV